jgi:hypothetical protein
MIVKPRGGFTRGLSEWGVSNGQIYKEERRRFYQSGQTKPGLVKTSIDGLKKESPRTGQEKRFELSNSVMGKFQSHPVLISGPHGSSIPVNGYENILLIASGIGIVSHIPYLHKILYDYSTCKTVVRRMHLVYESKFLGTFGVTEDAWSSESMLIQRR